LPGFSKTTARWRAPWLSRRGSSPSDERRFGSRALNLEQSACVLGEDFCLISRAELERPNHLDTRLLQRLERRCVGPEDEMVGTYRLEVAARRRGPVARRLQVHHLQVVARRVLDQHRLITAEEKSFVLQVIGVVHPPYHVADAAPDVACNQL